MENTLKNYNIVQSYIINDYINNLNGNINDYIFQYAKVYKDVYINNIDYIETHTTKENISRLEEIIFK